MKYSNIKTKKCLLKTNKLIDKKFFKAKGQKVNFYAVFFSAFLILLAFCLVINPAKYINSCYNGLVVWATCVLPSLLPFFIITKLLTEMKSLDRVFNKFSFFNRVLFNAPSCASYIFGMSIISGYPLGAKLISDFYHSGIINTKQANKLITFCSTSGPLFIIGSVGAIMLKNITLGYIIYASHILSAIFNGLLFRKAFVEKNDENKQTITKQTNYNTLLSSTMTSSISSVMVVGGFVAIFFMIIDILGDLKVFEPIVFLVSKLFGENSVNVSSAVLNGIVEVTRGCKDIASLGLTNTAIAIICSGLISFGGMSIHAQSLSFLTECKINIKFYFVQKITQTVFACVICYLLCLLFL